MGGTLIGEVNESLNGLTKLNTVAFKIIVGGLEYLGFSSNLCLGDTPQFKLIPMKTRSNQPSCGGDHNNKKELKNMTKTHRIRCVGTGDGIRG